MPYFNVPKPLRPINFLLGYIAFALFYSGAQLLHIGEPRLVPQTIIDQLIPFTVWTTPIYATQWLLIVIPFLLLRDEDVRSRIFGTYILASLIAAVFFVFWPTTIPRVWSDNPGFGGRLLSLIYLIDLPLNCVPSLHVSSCVISSAAFVGERGARKWLVWLWAVAVAVSTLTTKQHLVLDVVTGALLGGLCLYLAPRVFTFGEKSAIIP